MREYPIYRKFAHLGLVVSVGLLFGSCTMGVDFRQQPLQVTGACGGGMRLLEWRQLTGAHDECLHYVTSSIEHKGTIVPYRAFLLLYSMEDPNTSQRSDGGMGQVFGTKIKQLEHNRPGIYAVRPNFTIDSLDLTPDEEQTWLNLFSPKGQDNNPDEEAIRKSPLLPKLLSQLSEF